jgi:hypothetical protein
MTTLNKIVLNKRIFKRIAKYTYGNDIYSINTLELAAQYNHYSIFVMLHKSDPYDNKLHNCLMRWTTNPSIQKYLHYNGIEYPENMITFSTNYSNYLVNKIGSGILKPAIISDQLCCLLKCQYGTMKSRVAVAKELHKYFDDNGLKIYRNKRYIMCNHDLLDLFDIPIDYINETDIVMDGHNLQIFINEANINPTNIIIDGHKLQRFIAPHFMKD